MLNTGQLAQAASQIVALTELGVRVQQVTKLHDDLAARRTRVDTMLAAAREHRNQGQLTAALAEYDQLLAIATDQPELNEERDACAARADAIARQVAGADSLDQGDERQAIELLTQSQKMLPDAHTRTLLNRANIAWQRRELDNALESKDFAGAIDHGIELMTLEPSDGLSDTINNLRDRLIDEAMRQASQLHATGSTFQARMTLEAAMQRVSSPALDDLHAHIRAEELLSDAVQSEQQGRYDQARSLYLAALAAGGDRVAIEARIDDTDELAAMQFEMESAMADAAGLSRELSSMQTALADRDRAIQELERVADSLSYDLSCLKSDNAALDYAVHDLQREVNRLVALNRHLHGDIDYWRRKAQHRPTNNRPGNNHSTNNRPSNNRPTTNRPSNNRPTNNRPTTNRPTNNRPTTNRPSNNRPTTNRQPTNRPGSNRPATNRPPTKEPPSKPATRRTKSPKSD